VFRVRSPFRRLQKTVTFDEVGTTGLRHFGGYVYEEWLHQLSGKRGAAQYREMADNDAIIGAVLFAIEMLARGVEWRVEPGEDEADAEFIEECKDDMSGTWPDFIAETLSMLTYGWSYHEIVYKRRQGPDAEPPSRYADGKIGWRKLPVRAQETLEHWVFAEEDGGIEAMVQVAYDGIRRTIPMQKSLLFRTTPRRGNPEGRSILRTAWESYFYAKNLRPIEAIGIERDVAGLPVIAPPDGVDLEAPENAALKAAAQDLVTGIRKDEDMGVVKPSSSWEFALLKSAGASGTDPDKTIRRYEQRMAMSVLADFITLGSENVGSYALGKIKVDTFGQAMQAWLLAIAEVLNRYAIPRLLRLNGRPVTDPPRIVPGDVGQIDAEALATFLQALNLAGAPIDWSYDLMKALFEAAGLPEPEESPVATTARGDDADGNPYDDKPVEPKPPEPKPDEALPEVDPKATVKPDDKTPTPAAA
jgi:hypothetical protein